jgi:hypothetical protein
MGDECAILFKNENEPSSGNESDAARRSVEDEAYCCDGRRIHPEPIPRQLVTEATMSFPGSALTYWNISEIMRIVVEIPIDTQTVLVGHRD